MSSAKNTARFAGWLNLLLLITGVLSLGVFPRTYLVPGNAAETVATLSPLLTVLVMAELPIIFWLLLVGARAQAES